MVRGSFGHLCCVPLLWGEHPPVASVASPAAEHRAARMNVLTRVLWLRMTFVPPLLLSVKHANLAL